MGVVERAESGPKSIFEIGYYDLDPSDDRLTKLLNTSYDSSESLFGAIEEFDHRAVGDGDKIRVSSELEGILEGFRTRRHRVVDSKGHIVAHVGILNGDENKLQKLNQIIEDWQNLQNNIE